MDPVSILGTLGAMSEYTQDGMSSQSTTHTHTFNSSVHPLSSAYPGLGRRGKQSKQRCLDLPLPRHLLHLFSIDNPCIGLFLETGRKSQGVKMRNYTQRAT